MPGSNLDRPGECRTRGNCPQRLRREVPKEQSISMKPHFKSVVSLSLLLTAFLVSACSGPVGGGSGSGSGSGSGAGPFTIGGTVTGLTGTGLILQDNGGDNLAVTGNTAFTFKTAIANCQPYNVAVFASPTAPVQTCTVSGGQGTARANVTTVVITCSTGTVSIGGQVVSLLGTGLTLQDNGGDNLTVPVAGPFTFKTALPLGSAYAVTVSVQPSSPAQTCTVTNGSGTANANVGNVQVVCPAITHTIGGTVVGLAGTNSGMVLQDNLGDNLTISSNGPFQFNTPIADGSTYDVSVLVAPNTQPGVGIVRWFYQGTATSAVTSVIIDCGHNDWAWFDGSNTSNQKETSTPPPAPPPAAPTFDTSSPGRRKYPATWTDFNNNLWLFGGYGLTFTNGLTPPPTDLNDMWVYTGTQNYFGSFQNYWNNKVLVFSGTGPNPHTGAVTWTQPGAGGDLFLFGGQDQGLNFYNEVWRYNIAGNAWTLVSGAANQKGTYGTQGVAAASNIPGARWGATARMDASGKVWLFGGFGYDSAGTTGLLNDLWTYDIATNQWTWISGSNTVNQTGNYGTLGTPGATNIPGARQASMSFIDPSGNFWVFGGFDLDSNGNPAALNDLWQFKAGVWTWMSGANVVNQTGVYGTQGVAAATNVPGARWSSAAWTDLSGNFWIFGGEGYDSTGNGSLSDVWEYKGGQWIWTKGPASVSQGGIYGLTH